MTLEDPKDPIKHTLNIEIVIKEICNDIINTCNLSSDISFLIPNEDSTERSRFIKEHEVSLETFNRDHYINFIKEGSTNHIRDLKKNPFKYLKADYYKDCAIKIIKKKLIISHVFISIAYRELKLATKMKMKEYHERGEECGLFYNDFEETLALKETIEV